MTLCQHQRTIIRQPGVWQNVGRNRKRMSVNPNDALMKTVLTYLILGLAVSAIFSMVTPVFAATADNGGELIAVTNITVSPAVLMPGDTGTITFRVTNTGDQPVSINRAELYSSDLDVLNYQTYDKVGTLGPGVSMEFTFEISADASDGLYFPEFYLDFQDAGSMRYPVPVRIDSTGIQVSLIDVPTSFINGEENAVTLSVSNPRNSAVSSVTISPSGSGFTSNPDSGFIGILGANEVKEVTFAITPSQSTDLTFNVTYHNGLNTHFTTLTVPVTVGARSTLAELVVNNIEVSSSGGTYTVEGDVTNAGLEDAKSIVVTVGSPATPVDPTKVYVIGSLEPDDFSTFEITFTAQGSPTVPIQITYKDEDGNTYTTSEQVTLSSMGGSASASGSEAQEGTMGSGPGGTGGPGGAGPFGMSRGSGLASIPIVPIILVIIASIVLAVLWRKGVLGKVRARLRK